MSFTSNIIEPFPSNLLVWFLFFLFASGYLYYWSSSSLNFCYYLDVHHFRCYSIASHNFGFCFFYDSISTDFPSFLYYSKLHMVNLICIINIHLYILFKMFHLLLIWWFDTVLDLADDTFTSLNFIFEASLW